MTDMDKLIAQDADLIARLRETWCGYYGMDERHLRNPDGDEAADRIEALTAEVERLREAATYTLEIIRDSWGDEQMERGDDQAAKVLRAALEGTSYE